MKTQDVLILAAVAVAGYVIYNSMLGYRLGLHGQCPAGKKWMRGDLGANQYFCGKTDGSEAYTN